MIMKLLKVVTEGFCTLALHRKPPMSLLFTVKAPHSHRLLKSTFPPPCSSLTNLKLAHASLSSILPCFSRPRPLCITVSSPYNPKEIKQSTLNWLVLNKHWAFHSFPRNPHGNNCTLWNSMRSQGQGLLAPAHEELFFILFCICICPHRMISKQKIHELVLSINQCLLSQFMRRTPQRLSWSSWATLRSRYPDLLGHSAWVKSDLWHTCHLPMAGEHVSWDCGL